MDYNRLKIFTIVAEAGSMTQAGSLLRRSQSAVSQQMTILEEELGYRLFEKQGRQIVLTEDGKSLYQEVRPHLDSLAGAVSKIAERKEALSGHIKLGVVDDGTLLQEVAPLVSSFRKSYSGIRLTLQLGTSEEVEEALIDNRVDLGLLVNFTQRSLFKRIPVLASEDILVSTPGYIQKCGGFREVKSLLQADFVDFTDDFLCVGAWIRKNRPKLWPALKRKTPLVVAANKAVIKQLIRDHVGVGVLTKRTIHEELLSGELVQLFPGMKSLAVEHDLAYKKARTLRRCEAVLIEEFKKGFSGSLRGPE